MKFHCSFGVPFLLLWGCATAPPEYQAMTPKKPYGYKDVLQEDGSYVLSVVLPAFDTSKPLSFEYWDRRAEELCEGNEYEKNIYKATRPTQVTYGNYVSGGVGRGGGSAGNFTLEGKLTCLTAGDMEDG